MTGAALLSATLALAPAPEAATAFRAACAAAAGEAARAGRMAVARGGMLFLAAELSHLAGDPSLPGGGDPVGVIADFAAQLKAAGAALLVVPVPAKAAAHAATLLPGTGAWPDHADRARLVALAARGVAVLDLRPALGGAETPPRWCARDTHWSGAGCRGAAGAIAARIREQGWVAVRAPGRYRSETRTVAVSGDLDREAAAPVPEPVELDFVGTLRGGRLDPVADDPASPVLLMGDSHCLVFHAGGDLHAAGAGLADHLAQELGFPLDVAGVRGAGATAARVSVMRRARARRGWLARKKLVIWCFAAREFTRAAWKPVTLLPDAR